ncbi:MAG: hypothetical protein PHS17_11940 [Desulfobacterales bacterium]|nr:hypothetical protein [Desulfobacterales bacterium]
MRRKVAALVVPAVTTLMFGLLGASAFAADKVEGLELSKALAQVKIAAGLTEAERESLKAAATLRHVQTGEFIVQQGKEMGGWLSFYKAKPRSA